MVELNDILRNRFSLRGLITAAADRIGAAEAVTHLSDLDAVRLVQEREGYTPCYGRKVALHPGPGGLCQVKECCWRNFCSAYQAEAEPLDASLPATRPADIDAFRDFVLARGRRAAGLPVPGLSVTVRGGVALEPLSRKLVIGSPQSMICEAAEGSNPLRPIRLSFNAVQTRSSASYTTYYQIERSILWTASPQRIHNWYVAARSLIDDSTIDYLPHVTTESEEIAVWKTNLADFSALATPAFQRLDTPHMALPENEVLVSDPNFVPFLNLEIPFLEAASLNSIHDIMRDHPDELCTFRNFLFRNIDKIKDKSLGSMTFGADLQAVRREIDDSLQKLKADLARARMKHYIELTGGITAAFTLAVVCLTQHDSHTLAVIGPGGFLYVLSTKVSDYLSARLNLKDNPTYFLWMLGSGKRL
jgi:hypothetical protein